MFLCLLIAFNWWHFSGVFMSALKLNHFVKQLVQLIQTFISPFTNIKQSFSFYALFRCMHANNFQWTVQKYGCDHKCKKYALVYFNASFITCKEMVFLGELLRVAQVKSGRQFGWSLSCIFQFCVSYTSDGQWTGVCLRLMFGHWFWRDTEDQHNCSAVKKYNINSLVSLCIHYCASEIC